MQLEILPCAMSVCKLEALADFHPDDAPYFVGRTDEELSLLCASDAVPEKTLAREDGWRGFRVRGQLDFSLVGILAGLSATLAENHIPIFAVSTYNTDYLFVREDSFERAVQALKAAGHELAG